MIVNSIHHFASELLLFVLNKLRMISPSFLNTIVTVIMVNRPKLMAKRSDEGCFRCEVNGHGQVFDKLSHQALASERVDTFL